MNRLNELEESRRRWLNGSGIDGRTCYFAAFAGNGSIIHRLQDVTRLPLEGIERVLTGLVADRYADFFERRARGLDSDVQPMTLILSQGYGRGLKCRDVPLGKTCWDVSIYQQLLQELKPRTLLELGTGLGGSTLFFHDTCRMLGLDTRIITLDANHEDVSQTARNEHAIEFVTGNVKNIAELLPETRLRELAHPWLIVEDCHAHVDLILGHLQPMMEAGDYVVIEDNPTTARGSHEIHAALDALPRGTLMVDTFFTDMFGRNVTCSPDAIFRKMQN